MPNARETEAGEPQSQFVTTRKKPGHALTYPGFLLKRFVSFPLPYSGKNTSRMRFSSAVSRRSMRLPTTMSTPATVMPITI